MSSQMLIVMVSLVAAMGKLDIYDDFLCCKCMGKKNHLKGFFYSCNLKSNKFPILTLKSYMIYLKNKIFL